MVVFFVLESSLSAGFSISERNAHSQVHSKWREPNIDEDDESLGLINLIKLIIFIMLINVIKSKFILRDLEPSISPGMLWHLNEDLILVQDERWRRG